MNSPAAKPIAPSTHPALELIALAQLAPEEAGHRLRALLLANPRYFGNIPPTSFHAVLKIQEDTTYECLSSIAYDARLEQIRAAIEIKQAVGYSGAGESNGSEEFVRFYLSYDGGVTWLDQGMRSVKVSDAIAPRSLVYEVTLQMASARKADSLKPPTKVRAILSWNSPPPAGAPNWTPVWGNVMESETPIDDARMTSSMGLKAAIPAETPGSAVLAANLEEREGAGFAEKQKLLIAGTLPSSQNDPERRFLVYFFARAARHTLLGMPNLACKAIDPSPGAFAVPAFQFQAAEARFTAAS